MYNFFLVFIMAHLIGDFALQTNKIAKMKASSLRGIALHCGIILTVQVIFLSVYGIRGILIGILCGIIHFGVDCLKKILSKYFNHQIIYFFIDQLIHIAIIIILVLLLSPYVPVVQFDIIYVKSIISIIMLAFVSNITAKILIRDLYKEYSKREFFESKERFFDALFCLCLFLMLFLSLFLCLFFMAVSFYIFRRLQQSVFRYSTKISVIKFLVYFGASIFVFNFVMR